MKKIVQLQNLDCAHCADKMERAVAKIDGIKQVHVNFLLQKLAFEATDEDMERINAQVKIVCHRVEPDCVLKD